MSYSLLAALGVVPLGTKGRRQREGTGSRATCEHGLPRSAPEGSRTTSGARFYACWSSIVRMRQN